MTEKEIKPHPLKNNKWSARTVTNFDSGKRIVFLKDDVASAVKWLNNQLKDHNAIVNENDLQQMEHIELSYSGELIPVEIVQTLIDQAFEDVIK